MGRLPALYLPYVSGREHAFEVRLKTFSTGAPPGSVGILHAATGAGKTRAVIDIAEEGDGVLLTVPTNALAAEVEAVYNESHPGRVARWNADAFQTRKIARHEEMIRQAWEKDLVVSNPDILHLFTQHEYLMEPYIIRPSSFGMKNLNLLVFDEYHAYDERVLASILLHVLKSRGRRDHRQRFVFMSATPDRGLIACLEQLCIPFDEAATAAPTMEPMADDAGRMVRGDIDLHVRSDSISASLPNTIPTGRTLFIFSTFLEQQNAVRRLRTIGIPEEDTRRGFVQITGRKTNSNIGQDTWNQSNILLATSKVEVGLNIDELDHVVMEPGWSEQQFWQRFGRAARGRPAKVTLHFDGYPDQVLAGLRSATDANEATGHIRTLLRTDRRHVETVLRFVGAYAASYLSNPSPSADRRQLTGEHLPLATRPGMALIKTMMAQAESDSLADELGGSREWMQNVRRALGGLRGRSLQGKTVYEWSPQEVVMESIIYVLCRTDARQRDEDGVYRVSEIHAKPKDATLTYQILDGQQVQVPVRGALRREDFLRLPRAIETAVRRESGDPIPPFWQALCNWLALVPPDEISPLEVQPDDFII